MSRSGPKSGGRKKGRAFSFSAQFFSAASAGPYVYSFDGDNPDHKFECSPQF